jgi:hypothetical protein
LGAYQAGVYEALAKEAFIPIGWLACGNVARVPRRWCTANTCRSVRCVPHQFAVYLYGFVQQVAHVCSHNGNSWGESSSIGRR